MYIHYMLHCIKVDISVNNYIYMKQPTTKYLAFSILFGVLSFVFAHYGGDINSINTLSCWYIIASIATGFGSIMLITAYFSL